MTDDDRVPDSELPRDIASSMSARDVTSLVTLFVTMLASAKAEILMAMNENSNRAGERWGQHEKEHADQLRRLEVIESALKQHLDAEARDMLVMEARVRPFKVLGTTVALHWRDIVILVLGVLTLLGIGSDLVNHWHLLQ